MELKVPKDGSPTHSLRRRRTQSCLMMQDVKLAGCPPPPDGTPPLDLIAIWHALWDGSGKVTELVALSGNPRHEVR